MNTKIVLRFRDLLAKTIYEHSAVIDKNDCVWWGWWSKDNEQVPHTAISILQQEINRAGYIWIYLADSGSYRLYKSKLIEIDYAEDGGRKAPPDLDLVPIYYRGSKYKMWLKFAAIEDAVPEEIESCIHDDCDDFFLVPQENSMKGSAIGSIKSLLGSNHQTIYFIKTAHDGYNIPNEETSKIQEKETIYLSIESGLEEKHLSIENGESGHSYETLFGDYLKNAKHVEIVEPYLMFYHQKKNFFSFCSLVAKYGNAESINLTTKPGEKHQHKAIAGALESLSSELSSRGISLTYNFSKSIHARSIATDDGWTIKCDRGLDIFQRPEGELDTLEQSFRPCKKVEVDIFKAEK